MGFTIPFFGSKSSTNNTDSSLTNTTTQNKVKPCCVCQTEKSKRDECGLINGLEDLKCKDYIKEYKDCMKGYGFSV